MTAGADNSKKRSAPDNSARDDSETVVADLLARGNRLGSDPRNTNYAGGNASAKGTATDPVTGEPAELLWVKGSGGDLGTLTASGLAVLRLDRLRALEGVYPGVDLPAHPVHERFEHRVPVLGRQFPMSLRSGAQLPRGQRRIGHVTTVYRAPWRQAGPELRRA